METTYFNLKTTNMGIALKSVEGLKDYTFTIPDYQRGYKWETKHVNDLLNDIWEFHEKEKEDANDFYCIQPLVVAGEEKDKKFEVIDGQQRLTTIYLILKYLDQEQFKLCYDTRECTTQFLLNLKLLTEDQAKAKGEATQDADRFHLYNAWVTINNWFSDDNKKALKQTLLDKVKFIWYVAEGNKQDHFDRLNAGKIPLTSAELIKARLFLDKKEEVQEISWEWDLMERELRKDDFWYFLSNSPKPASCISLLFEIVLGVNDDAHNLSALFDKYVEQSKEPNKRDIWQEVKACFYRLAHWFEDRTLYHYVGYLVARKGSREDVGSYYRACYVEQNKNKNEVVEFLKCKMKLDKTFQQITEWRYGKQSHEIQNLLLLFNVLTVLGDENASGYFPFVTYKKQKWSLEHIVPQNPEEEWTDRHWTVYKSLKPEIETIEPNNEDTSEPSQNKKTIKDALKELLGDDYDLHHIANLALLRSKDNSKLQNVSFEEKRKKIIEMDKNGGFIPPCTRNVFLKYYHAEDGQTTFWTQQDAESYLDAIAGKIEKFILEQPKAQ